MLHVCRPISVHLRSKCIRRIHSSNIQTMKLHRSFKFVGIPTLGAPSSFPHNLWQGFAPKSDIHAVELSGSHGHGISVDFEGTVESTEHRIRLDFYLSENMAKVSRARVQTSIKEGYVTVNGQIQTKPSMAVKSGDLVRCTLPPSPPLHASPEPIPLDVIYEDKHLLVVNKPAHLVVHPSPGHYSGTLVNALLHHCQLPAMSVLSGSVLSVEDSDDDADMPPVGPVQWGPPHTIRPGIVHRLDKGTSGLLVVAKEEFTHSELCDQFKMRSVDRTYVSIASGVMGEPEGRVETFIGRDPRERKRMAVVSQSARGGRYSASRYKSLEVLAGGGASMVEWKLETGRTHQIRVHAKHLGHPLLGDDMYNGGQGKSSLASILRFVSKNGTLAPEQLASAVTRPCLHAQTLGFTHPHTGIRHFFSVEPPEDFLNVAEMLRLAV